MMHRTRNYLTALLVALALVLGVATPAAAVSSGVEKNVTRMADGIVGTLADWVPLLVLFFVLGAALAAIGVLKTFRQCG